MCGICGVFRQLGGRIENLCHNFHNKEWNSLVLCVCNFFVFEKSKLISELERYRKVSGEVSKMLLDNAEQEMKEK